jgi:hypothetical protein
MDDYISRQAAIDAVNNTIAKYIPTFIGRYEKIPLELARAIKGVPPVTATKCIAKISFSKDDLRKIAEEQIEAAIKQEPKTEWIPVNEKMPEVTGYYLIQYSRAICRDEMAVAYYSVEEKESDPNYEWEFKPCCGEYKEVVAWMPLPKPYENEG